jgi:phage-related protein
MATIAELMVKLSLEDGAFQRNLRSSREKLDSWGDSFRGWGTKLTAGVTTPIVAASGVVVSWASDLEQTLGATEVLWGSNTDTMLAWAQGADRSMGMTQNSALQNANRFNAMFKTIGHGQGVVMDMSQGFTQLSADLSAMWGGSPDEAADALTSALRGNYEAMDKYNVNLTEAMVSQEAMNVAIANGRTEVTEADKVQARYNLIMEQTADSQGQFARETDTTAGKLAIATARAKNAATTFGRLLLPYVNKLLNGFSKMVDWIENLSDTQRKWVLGIAAVAAAIGPVLLIIGMLLPGLSALIAVIGFLVSPIGLVVIAVAALAAGLIYAYTHFEGFRNIVNTVASVIKDVAIGAFEAFMRALEPIKDHIQNVIAVLTSLVDFVKAVFAGDWGAAWEALKSVAVNAFNALISWITLLPSMLLAALGTDLSGLISKGGEWIQAIWDGAKSLWDTSVAPWLSGLSSDALTWIGDVSASLLAKGEDLLQGFWQGAVNRWASVSSWIGTRSTDAVAAAGDLTSTLWQKGVDLLVGMGDGAVAQWANLKTWLGNRGAMATQGVGNVLSTLWQKGVDLIVGMGNGVTAQWANLKSWLSGLPGYITNAIGSLGGLLYDAGVALLQGLYDGITAKWEDVKSLLSSITSSIPDWKGPPERDRMLLYSAGQLVMGGFGRGLDDGWDDVTRKLTGYVPTIGGGNSMTNSGMNTGGNVIQIITLEPGKWAEFLEDAQAGGQFAKRFASELSLMGS